MPKQNEAGFALVEALVATSIVALMTGVAFQAMYSAAFTARTMNERRSAILLAQSAIANFDADPVGRADGKSGKVGSLTWHVTVGPYGDEALTSGPPLQRVTAEVSDETGRVIINLQTLRLPR